MIEIQSSSTSSPESETSSSAQRSRTRKFASRMLLVLRLVIWNRYFAFLAFMFGFSEVLSRISALSPIRLHYRIEVPALLAVYWGLNFALRPRKISAFIAALPIVIFYTGHELFFLSWGNVFKAIDAENLPELLKVLPWIRKLAVIVGLSSPIILLVCYANYRKYRRVLIMGGLAVLFLLTLELRPGAVLWSLNHLGLDVAEWSDAESVNRNGRFTTMLYFEAKRRQALADTANYRAQGDFDQQVRMAADFIRKHGNRRNVHLVVLESFIDPTLFNAVTFSKDPRHPDFAALVGDKQSFSISPVFGGETAQAEFEALCGAPGLQRLSEIEFDDFSGEPAGCMPGILRQAGYSTTVTNGFEPNYFNSTKAYTGIGFEKIYFPREYGSASSSYLTARNVSESEYYMFDGDLFDQNLAYVERTLRDNPRRPMLNYILGIYGHEPHDMDTDKRPLFLSVTSGQKDEQLLRAANQYWYRTQAIAKFVRSLTKLDPKSVIIIVSDHLPPLEGVKSYSEYRYLNNVQDNTHLNRILIFENGKVVRHKTIHHYEIPSVIYDYLTSKEFCTELHCNLSDEELEQKYMAIMSRAVGQR